jgi:hypothetical protein
MQEFDEIINSYLSNFNVIDKEDIQYLVDNACWINQDKVGIGAKKFRIINNVLYLSTPNRFENYWEKRFHAFVYMMLETLKQYKISDCEFVMYDDDGINLSNVHAISREDRILPIIVSTSVLNSINNVILCPDFTFTFGNEPLIRNHEEMCRDVVNKETDTVFKNKIPKLVYRGAGNTYYRSLHIRCDDKYDAKSVINTISPEKNESLTYKEKSDYKYQLHLNGHEGSDTNGAYSSAFKWCLMGKSVVFYSAPVIYREFWMHPIILSAERHFVYSSNLHQLDANLNYIINNEEHAETIANNGYEFFKKYLLEYKNVLYYMQKLLNEYALKMNYTVELSASDKILTKIMPY